LELTDIGAVPLQDERDYGALMDSGFLEESHPGCVKVADVHRADGSYVATLISIYGIHGDPALNGVRYVPTTVHRMLSDLTPLLDRSRRSVIMGGDLNISPQIGYPDTRHHELVIDRIKAFGLVDCLGRFHDDYVQTHRHPGSAQPWQDDWIFAGKRLAESLRSCDADHSEEAWSLSDHCPVTAMFEI
jgi:exonuclease III